MKTVKYFLLARFIRLFLQFGFLFAVLAIVLSILIRVFGLKPYIKGDDWSFGDAREGYALPAGLSMNIPDTIVYYNNGEHRVYKDDLLPFKYELTAKDTISEKIINRFEVFDTKGIEVSSRLYVPSSVSVVVKSNNWKHNLFWAISSQVHYIVTALFFLVLIKLTNRYMDNEIFEQRSFKLVASLGWLLIGNEVFNFVVSMVNGSILQHPSLHSASLMHSKAYSYLDINLDFFNGFSFTNIGLGILIILLAEVLRIAIFAKQENQLTI
ncbi:DUF2975 domain-containing protein [Pedobacter sp. KR3-3]|uniref:DUF2975 domain-containing protein n=1 Tax=Pedobacter albus TaxID=3113905 RepID=A0ABU7I5H2_9SPHI|nr:DUF2975 domain-containing protein [Pedobacter sp. KR3-3]MEE1944713.1 DUF2975 domain-containing protein [Pedobacter sp. KR3-3]